MFSVMATDTFEKIECKINVKYYSKLFLDSNKKCLYFLRINIEMAP